MNDISRARLVQDIAPDGEELLEKLQRAR